MWDFAALGETRGRGAGHAVDSDEESAGAAGRWAAELRRLAAAPGGVGGAVGSRSAVHHAAPASHLKPSAPGSRRLQILVLHGRQSNEHLVSFQLSGLKQAVGKDADIRFLEGDIVWEYQDGVDGHDADQMTVALAKGKPFKMWFRHSTDDPRNRIDFFKQQDPHVKVTYSEYEASVDKLLSYVEQEGPVDAVVGCFEGSIAVHLAVAKLARLGLAVPWNLSVFFGSMCIRDDSLKEPLASRPAEHPTIHVFGRSDESYFYQRTAAGRTAPEDYYRNSVVLTHAEGHQLPSPAAQESRELYGTVADHMRFRAGLSASVPSEVPTPPKPTSLAIRDLSNMTSRKLRVLALCGGHSCAALIKFQTNQLRAALGKNEAEWTFLEGTKDWTWYDGEPTVSAMEKKIASGAQLKNWYMDTCHVDPRSESKPGRSNSCKQFDPTTRVEYHDVSGAVQHLRDFIMDQGPFDVLVGFSQGCIMMHLLIGHLRREAPAGLEKHPERWKHARHSAEDMPWRCSVFFCGMHIRDRDYFDLFESKSKHPTVHVFGKTDEYCEYSRDGYENKPQEEYYVDPVVLTHEQGHEMPTVMPRSREVYGRVVTEIWRHCGGRPP